MDYIYYVNEVMQERRKEYVRGYPEDLNPSEQELKRLYADYLERQNS